MSRYEELVTEATKAYRASKQNKKNDLSDYIPSLSDAVSVLIHDRDRYKAERDAMERAIMKGGAHARYERFCYSLCLNSNTYQSAGFYNCKNQKAGSCGVCTNWQFDEARFSFDNANDKEEKL